MPQTIDRANLQKYGYLWCVQRSGHQEKISFIYVIDQELSAVVYMKVCLAVGIVKNSLGKRPASWFIVAYE